VQISIIIKSSNSSADEKNEYTNAHHAIVKNVLFINYNILLY